ncbi:MULTISPECIES: TlpA disulfide reductase family protein [unclassified Arcicella]|uniref:TlpA family protein disulfide reductase n=1 Tax=unclassified Arcicella TaxID=2644986 RepID=UPI00285AC067|nr:MULTISPECIES: TlpA disulfide reductase family protein [unclassified Arcicella]MDR6560627.1 thiol-disulfide isomerase/thioredoxin [Arcicella sp. BE51]MDR6810511.1 thiol-disulfide isomerase/thioredoxin [Arcicella sp. BE140]MDR6821861.1 thiol-disulfide isomerase/thioredoxin [Arcicella sp. BE139]
MKNTFIASFFVSVCLFSHFCRIENKGYQFSVEQDSVLIKISKTKQELFLELHEGGLDEPSVMSYGTTKIPRFTFIRDAHWKTDFYYPLGNATKITFVQDASQNYWLAETGDTHEDAFINFEVNYCREQNPKTNGIKSFMDEAFLDKSYQTNPEKREKVIALALTKKIAYLDDYATKNNFSTEAKMFWTAMIQYEMYSRKLHGVLMKSKEWDFNYLNKLTQMKSFYQNDTLLSIPSYRLGASMCNDLMALLENNLNPPSITQRYSVINKHFTGKTHDWLLSSLMKNIKTNTFVTIPKPEEVKQISKLYESDCNTQEYKDYILGMDMPKVAFGKDDLLFDVNRNNVNFKSLIQKGKVTYIDFWASWCAPCRAEMPDSKRLKDEYEAKGVNFVYISIDDNSIAWQKAHTQVGLDNTRSFLSSKASMTNIKKQFNITTIPRYLLFDKNGKIVSANAPRPSEHLSIKQHFIKLLEQKY